MPKLTPESLHEGAHVVVAKRLGVEVVHASADPADPHVRTRIRYRDAGELIAALERLAMIDLAGAAVEAEASDGDEQNAAERCAEIVRLRHGVGDGEQLDAAQLAEAGALNRRLRARAAELVTDNALAIMHTAAELRGWMTNRVGGPHLS